MIEVIRFMYIYIVSSCLHLLVSVADLVVGSLLLTLMYLYYLVDIHRDLYVGHISTKI